MSKKPENLILGGLALVGLAWFLSSNPKCKTIAQHLASHGLDDIIGGLFGV